MEIPFTPEYPNIQKVINNEKWTLFVKSKCIVNCEAFIHVMVNNQFNQIQIHK